MPYQTIDHTADLGIEVRAANGKDLFREASRALSELLCGPRPFVATGEVRIAVAGLDWPDLMINWLRELLYLFNGKNVIVGPVDIQALTEFALEAVVPVDNTGCAPHDRDNEIKAVTYHQLQVEIRADGWRARVIFDI
jgi:SHS2 domain-containing protein